MDLLNQANRKRFILMALVVIAFILSGQAHAVSPRLKDLADINLGGAEIQVMGYGLVIGLDGTGDSKSSVFTTQALENMLRKMGITVPEGKVKTKNTAAVMVSTKVNPWHTPGTSLDVSVSSLGDAKSLAGGTLLSTALGTLNNQFVATAQGPVSVGGYSVDAGGGNEVSSNHVLVGRIPSGATVERALAFPSSPDSTITVQLRSPDFTTAERVAQAISAMGDDVTAVPLDGARVRVSANQLQTEDKRIGFLASLEVLRVQPDAAARVIINERTGTIVAGQFVTISPIAIAHGSLSIRIGTESYVSQPEPLSKGETTTVRDRSVHVTESPGRFVPLDEPANVGELASMLNSLGVSSRDLIAIFQALKEAGALRAELRII